MQVGDDETYDFDLETGYENLKSICSKNLKASL